MGPETQRSMLINSTIFISEILLAFMILSGSAVIGVNTGFYHFLPHIFMYFGIFVGLLTISLSSLAIYVLLYRGRSFLKYFLIFFICFVVLQILFLIRLHFLTENFNVNDGEKAFTIVLDVNMILHLITSVVLVIHFYRKGSTIEMVKL